MSDKIIPLHAVAPVTADEEAKATAIRILEELLEEAKRGEIIEFAVIIVRPGDDIWSERMTPTRKKSEWIGKLMIMMVDWITHMSEEDDNEESFNPEEK